jgi:hypothetical protein
MVTRQGAVFVDRRPRRPRRTVVFRSAMSDHFVGVRTFYLSSFRPDAKGVGVEYCLKVIRRGRHRCIVCSCPDFFHRCFPVGRSCKHVALLRTVIRGVGGVSKIPHGVVLKLKIAR